MAFIGDEIAFVLPPYPNTGGTMQDSNFKLLWPFEKSLQAFSVHELLQLVIKIEAAIAEKTTRSVQVDASLFRQRINARKLN